MKARLITAGIGIPLTISIWLISHLWHEIPMLILVLFSGLIINYEILSISNNKTKFHYPFFRFGIMFTLSLLFTYLYGMKLLDQNAFFFAHFAFFIVFFYWILGSLLYKDVDIETRFEYIGMYTISYITLIMFFPQILLLKVMFANAWGVILLFTFCWISDACGLFVGSAFGKHPLPLLPSKSKTVEGYAGAFVLTTFLGVIFYYIQGVLHLPFQWELWKWIVFGATMSISSGFGDLIESLIKRWGNKKDSSDILPGMGGLFDAIDAQIYSIPIVLFFFSL